MLLGLHGVPEVAYMVSPEAACKQFQGCMYSPDQGGVSRQWRKQQSIGAGKTQNAPHADKRHLGALLREVILIVVRGSRRGRRAVQVRPLLEGQRLGRQRVARAALAGALARRHRACAYVLCDSIAVRAPRRVLDSPRNS